MRRAVSSASSRGSDFARRTTYVLTLPVSIISPVHLTSARVTMFCRYVLLRGTAVCTRIGAAAAVAQLA